MIPVYCFLLFYIFPSPAKGLEVKGKVTWYDLPVCALVLANGVSAFTCDKDGEFLLDAMPDANGGFTLFAFAEGFMPYKAVLSPEEAMDHQVSMEIARSHLETIRVSLAAEDAEKSQVRVSGRLLYHGDTPLCGLVIINGESFFTCNGDGRFNMIVPLDASGNLSVMAFVDGLIPYSDTIEYQNAVFVPADYPTIQEAISASRDGDTILVSEGIYKGEGNRDLDFSGKSITLRSMGSPEFTVIDCESLGRGAVFQHDETNETKLAGLTIQNASVKNRETPDGGALRVTGSANPHIENCIFRMNQADTGGALSIEDNASPVITGCRFESNEAILGGGISINGCSSPAITACSFTENRAWRGYHGNGSGGGAWIAEHASPSLVNCIFSKNEGAQEGGAIAIFEHALPEVLNCVIKENKSVLGGGIYLDGHSEARIIETLITENTGANGPFATGSGGGIFARGNACPVIEDCVISNNIAGQTGGGICFLDTSQPVISHCDISGNLARGDGYRLYGAGHGGGVYAGTKQNILLESITIQNNSVTGSSSCSGAGIYSANSDQMVLQNCLVTGNQAFGFMGHGRGAGIINKSGTLYLSHCTIADNLAHDPELPILPGMTGMGGAVFADIQYNSLPSFLYAKNSLFWGNQPDNLYFAEETKMGIMYCLVEGGWPGDHAGSQPEDGTGNISNAPVFQGKKDYHLKEESPAIDAGSAFLDFPEQDLDGIHRPYGNAPDMGAYEWIPDA